MNDLQFAGRYQCLPIKCSGRLVSCTMNSIDELERERILQKNGEMRNEELHIFNPKHV
jgi:hypothetical protein